MTDNDKEIVQTLKNHIEAEDCVTCESFEKCDEFLLTKNTLDLINRQQAEIERLTNNIGAMAATMSNSAKATRHEAVREFVEKLKERKQNTTMDSRICTIEMIDNLVKEMVGEEE